MSEEQKKIDEDAYKKLGIENAPYNLILEGLDIPRVPSMSTRQLSVNMDDKLDIEYGFDGCAHTILFVYDKDKIIYSEVLK